MTRPTTRLRCEHLEDRSTPTTITVTTATDVVDPNDGHTSLREAINQANAITDPSDTATIQFDPSLNGSTIRVSQVGGTTFGPSAFEVHHRVVIDGSGQRITRAATAPHMRLFTILGDPPTPAEPFTTRTLRFDDVELIGGRSDTVGGAVYAAPNTTLVLNSVVLSGNKATGEGGAVYAHNAVVQVQNSTLTGNRVRPAADGTSLGAAIRWFNDGTAPKPPQTYLTIYYSTLFSNTGGSQVDAVLDSTSFVQVDGSILYTPNRPTGVDDLVVTGTGVQATAISPGDRRGHKNLIGAVSDPATWDVVSSADPLLGSLRDNGGLTRTMAPQAGSPAVNAGHATNTYIPLWTDQRGLTRSVGDYDLGAFETGLTTPPPPQPAMAIGAAAGQSPEVRVFDSSGREVKRFLAYDPSFLGGVSVTLGDVTGDGVDDIVTGAGASGGPHVKVFDGVTFEEIRSFYAYTPIFTGGVSVAVDDVTGDGLADIITGAGAGGGPHVKVFDGFTGQEVASFYAYVPTFAGGVTVATGDLNDDGLADVITGAGAGGGPHVKVIEGTRLRQFQADGQIADSALLASYYAFAPDFAGGVYVSAGADINSDVMADVVIGAGAGGGPHVKVVDTAKMNTLDANGGIADTALLSSFYAFEQQFGGGVRVGEADAAQNGVNEIVVGAGPTGGPRVRVLQAIGLAEVSDFYAFDPTFPGGVYVG